MKAKLIPVILALSVIFKGICFLDAYENVSTINNCCAPCYEWDFWFDPMAIKSCQMPLEYAEAIIATSATVNNNFDNFLDPTWSFGFRLGAGVKAQCNGWSFRADYTHWYNNTEASTSLSGTGIVGPEGIITNLQPKIADSLGFTIELPGAGDLGVVSTRLKYFYNLLDVTTGWSCCVCNGLGLMPYGGFRGFWYSTDIREVSSDSTGVTFSAAGDPSTATNDYHAYGIVGGLRFAYNLCSCFNFYGSFGGSIIAGSNRNKINFLATGADGVNITFDETICLFIHSLEGAWGITYDSCFFGYNTRIGLGYEVTRWSDILPHPFRENSTTPGNATLTSNGLFLQAITVRMGVSY